MLLLFVFIIHCRCFTLIFASQPTIVTVDERFDVAEGGTARLPCKVDNLGNYAVLWKRGTTASNSDLLFADTEKMTSDHRMELKHDIDTEWTLIIHQVEPYDSSDYHCQLTTSPARSVRHSLQVLVPPSISISPDGHLLVVEPGELVVLDCFPAGNPRPAVVWKRLTANLPNDRSTWPSEQLTLRNIQPQHAGVYQCIADNGLQPMARAQIEIQVHLNNGQQQFAPWVETTNNFMPAKISQNVNVSCLYNAEPPPQVTWIFNSFSINLAEDRNSNMIQYNSRKDNFTETTLTINNIQLENFGQYTCRIANNVGTEEKSIHVSGKPGPPTIEIDPPNALKPTLRWKIVSADPIIEYRIMYRLVDEQQWQLLPPIRASEADHTETGEWHHSYQLRSMHPSSDYELQVQARNAYGWGSMTDDYVVYTTASAGQSSNVDEIATDVDIADKAASSSLVPRLALLLLLSFLAFIYCRI